MKSIFTMGVLCLLQTAVFCQNLTQTVRGTVTDIDSKSPLIGATVLISGSDPLIGAITDLNGEFRLEKVPIGRITLEISYIGYEPQVMPNILVYSGKESVLNLTLQESTVKMEEIVVTATQNKGEALNEMALISARSFSSEETSRYAGGFNDPARIVANFAGVTATQDGSGDIIVRGNSPKYLQWRLEGVQITNPNHFADQSGASGTINALNNNMISTSDFYTGAFAPEFGDALSGVYDVRLRRGNNEKRESVLGLGILGTDLTLEGPFKKGYNGSYIVNYRYSNIALVDQLGLIPDDINGIPKFQDGSFKISLPTENFGSFSIFGLGGLSSVFFEDISPTIWDTPGDRAFSEEIIEDYDKKAYLLNTGVNHTINLSKDSYLATTLAFSSEGIEDRIFEYGIIPVQDNQGEERDSVVNRVLNFSNDFKRNTLRSAVTYHHKIDARNKVEVGSKYNHFSYDTEQSQFFNDPSDRMTLVDFNGSLGTLRNFVSWKHRLNDQITFVGGLHNMNVLYNNKSTLEPRLAASWQVNETFSLNAGYGKHSTMEAVHNYFTQVEVDGQLTSVNEDLDLLKANHYIIGAEKRFTPNLRAKIELYYQDLYNLPVENNDTSFYATINEGLEFRFVDLVNEGKGRNYGVEVTVERFLMNGFYFLANGSLYESKYTAMDGVERNTQYNGNYLVNLLLGKEITGLGKKKNQTLGLNGKIFFGGGKKIIPLLRDEDGNLAVNPEENRYWDYDKAYETGLDDVYMITLSASYKWNKPKATHEIFVNLDNVTNNKRNITEFYDPEEPDNIGHLSQVGFFPNVMYRVYF